MSERHCEEITRPRGNMEARLAAYVAAAGGAALTAGNAEAAVVGSRAVQPFGINQEVNIDYNGDGQVDFQVDHDRYNLNGSNLDYLQIDKNDVNSAANPLPIEGFATFPTGDSFGNRASESGYITDGTPGAYPLALTNGTSIGLGSSFDFQEGDNFNSSGKTIRANRLIDEDQTQIDRVVGGLSDVKVQVPAGSPNFLGLGGEVRYLGLKMELNSSGVFNYGWIGIRIDNEADATGAVVGYGYESEPGVAILAGDAGPLKAGDYDGNGHVDGNDFLVWQRQNGTSVPLFTGADGDGNGLVNGNDLGIWKGAFGTATVAGEVTVGAVPEPGSVLMGAVGGLFLLGRFAIGRRKR